MSSLRPSRFRYAAFMALLACTAILSGCGNPAARLIGTWDAELAAPVATDSTESRLKNAIVGLMKMRIEFRADGTLQFQASALGYATDIGGTWKYLKSEGNTLVLETKSAQAAASSITRVTFIDDNHIELIPPAGNAAEPMRLGRVVATK